MYKLQTLRFINRDRIHPFIVPAIILLVVISIVGTSIWLLPGWLNNSSKSENTTGDTSPGTSVSPLIFGSNLQLSTTSNQVLTSTSTRNLLQTIHTRIVRIPLAANVSDTTLRDAAQSVQEIGATPLVILRGITDTQALEDDTHAISIMNALFGQQTVYYEYDNEVDALGITALQYTASWNAIIPQLKQLAPHGRFVGPVNSQYSNSYLTTFLQHARPLPDAVSWHEYTCDRSWSNQMCIGNIVDWTTHITNARQSMQATIHVELPIMITEWNYAANALPDDGKSNNPAFMTTWTTQAFQTLAINHILASMQYASTNSATPLIGKNEKLTAQGIVFQHEYEQLIPKVQEPAGNGSTATTAPSATSTAQVGSTPTATSTEPSSQSGGSTATIQPSSAPTPTATSVVSPPQPTPTPQPHGPQHYVDTYCPSDKGGVSVSGQWSAGSSGGYSGPDSRGSCNGSFLWTLTASTVTHAATYFEYLPGGYNWSCTIFVYIPTNHAVAPHATYWIHSQDQYLANITVNQQPHSGWYRLQAFQFSTSVSNSTNYIFAQLRNNDSSTGQDLAIDAIKFDCSGS